MSNPTVSVDFFVGFWMNTDNEPVWAPDVDLEDFEVTDPYIAPFQDTSESNEWKRP